MVTKNSVMTNNNESVTNGANLDTKHSLNEEYLRLLWDVCKNFGLSGECIFLCMKAKLKHTNQDS